MTSANPPWYRKQSLKVAKIMRWIAMQQCVLFCFDNAKELLEEYYYFILNVDLIGVCI